MHHVTGRDDWARVRALRYESLSNRGDIVPCAERVHADSHDLALSSSTFLLLKHGRAIGSTRASFSASRRRRDLPASATFHREMAAAIGADASVVEASLTVTDPQVASDRRAVTLHLLKAHMIVCAVERADWLIAAVRIDEIGFYRRMLNMEILSGVERCPGMATPQVLMGLQYREQAALLFARIPMLSVSAGDEKEYETTGRVQFAADVPRDRAA